MRAFFSLCDSVGVCDTPLFYSVAVLMLFGRIHIPIFSGLIRVIRLLLHRHLLLCIFSVPFAAHCKAHFTKENMRLSWLHFLVLRLAEHFTSYKILLVSVFQ